MAFCEGGSVTQIGGYRVHRFYGNDTLVVVEPGEVDVIVVGGGGGGGFSRGGGGGGGGVVVTEGVEVTEDVAITIGAGGAGGVSGNIQGANGTASAFGSIVAGGGGGGGGSTDVSAGGYDGLDGANGGGAGASWSGASPIPVPGQSTGGGFAGGSAFLAASADRKGGGGGGAGGPGGDGAAGLDGPNGDPAVVWGFAYGGGGQGGSSSPTFRSKGGGGGAGTPGADGVGGGGGGGVGNSAGARGGSGVVVVRYEHEPPWPYRPPYLYSIWDSPTEHDGSDISPVVPKDLYMLMAGTQANLALATDGEGNRYFSQNNIHAGAVWMKGLAGIRQGIKDGEGMTFIRAHYHLQTGFRTTSVLGTGVGTASGPTTMNGLVVYILRNGLVDLSTYHQGATWRYRAAGDYVTGSEITDGSRYIVELAVDEQVAYGRVYPEGGPEGDFLLAGPAPDNPLRNVLLSNTTNSTPVHIYKPLIHFGDPPANPADLETNYPGEFRVEAGQAFAYLPPNSRPVEALSKLGGIGRLGNSDTDYNIVGPDDEGLVNVVSSFTSHGYQFDRATLLNPTTRTEVVGKMRIGVRTSGVFDAGVFIGATRRQATATTAMHRGLYGLVRNGAGPIDLRLDYRDRSDGTIAQTSAVDRPDLAPKDVVWIRMQLDASGAGRMRVWKVGTPEPSGWDVEQVSPLKSVPLTAEVGHWLNNNGSGFSTDPEDKECYAFGDLGIGIDGAEAPTEPEDPPAPPPPATEIEGRGIRAFVPPLPSPGYQYDRENEAQTRNIIRQTLEAVQSAGSSTVSSVVNQINQYIETLTVAWADVTGKPSTFPPSAHTHELDDLPDEFPPEAHTHDAADVVSGEFDNARVSAGNVTQHQGAINHDALLNYVAAEHAPLNDEAETDANLWSAEKIATEIAAGGGGVDAEDIPYDTRFEILGPAGNEERRFLAVRPFRALLDAPDSRIVTASAPTDDVTFEIHKNGTKVGEATILDGETVGTVTSDAGEVNFGAGDQLQVVTPASVHSMGDVALTISGHLLDELPPGPVMIDEDFATAEAFLGARAIRHVQFGNARHFLSYDAAGESVDSEAFGIFVLRSNTSGERVGLVVRGSGTSSGTATGYVAYIQQGSGFQLANYNAGTLNLLGLDTTVTTFKRNVRYAIRLRAEGTDIRAKYWKWGIEPEPSAWDHVETDSAISTTGRVGMFTFQATGQPRLWEFVSAGMGGPVAPLPGETVGTNQYADDQSGLSVGSTVTGYTRRWGTSGNLDVVRYDPGVPPLGWDLVWQDLPTGLEENGGATGGKWVMHSSAGEAGLFHDSEDRADFEALGSFSLGNFGGATRAGFIFRGSGEEATRTGYVVELTGTIERIRIRKILNGTSTTLDDASTSPGTPSTSETWWVRGQVIGGDIKGKAWRDGDAEPGWQVEASDSDIPAAGKFGIMFGGSTLRLDTVDAGEI
jgi:hypothetical protein